MGLITHIVSFKYSPSISSTERHFIASSFLALKETCLLPSDFYSADDAESPRSGAGDGEDGSDGRYIVGCIGGCNNSPEGLNGGFEHTFILTFRNKKERDYYLDQDPAHQAFKKMLGGKLASAEGLQGGIGAGVWVFDFEAGVFE